MDTLWLGLPFLAQFLIGFYYVFFGFWNIYHWSPLLQTMAEENIPHPYLLLPIGIAWQVLAGFMIIAGFYVKVGALSLIPFTIIASFIFHPFWKYSGKTRKLNFTVFVTNLTISLGALLLLIVPIANWGDLFSHP